MRLARNGWPPGFRTLIGLLAAAAATISGAQAQNSEVPLWQRVQALIATGEFDRAVEAISAGSDPEVVAERYESVVRSLYYTGRDLPAVVRIAENGIEFDLAEAAAAERRRDTADATLFRGRAKAVAYNLASFTWPGWDEPGIGIRTRDLEAGLAAARLNLRLGEELERGPEPMANAYFILAGHELAASRYEAAAEHFREFGEIARSADLEALVLLAEGYEVITRAAAGSGTPGSYMLEPVRERLREALDSDAAFWIDQLDTAWRIFVTG